MTKNDYPIKSDNFWSGLAFGVMLGASSLFFLGTRRGRKILKDVIDSSENFEEFISEAIEELETRVPAKGDIEAQLPSGHNLQSVINKIQSVFPEKEPS